jgi:DNA-binding transcriptional regulator YiaG
VENIENRKHAVEKGLHLSGEKCSYSKLTENQVLFIREHNEISNPEFAKLFNVSRNTISSARNYKSWKMVEKLC